jgi:glucose/arabinose dehydrogenase/regulation of enolase protein 1 (concanavalin A-like superfamily)
VRAATLPPPNLPAGFTQTQLAHGLSKPIALAFAPNGDLYIAQQGGTVLIERGGQMLSTPLVTLPNVYSTGECGLLGLALDPNFATNGYIYLSYVVNITNSSGVTQPFSRLSRFTVSGNSINTATEKVLSQGNQLQNQHHAGNDLKIGPDGKLWWSVGDNVPSITNAQALTNIYGKILRFNLDGSVPADNPFTNVPGAVKAIYAYGLRNPWRFTFLPDGRAMTADTGSSYAEELNVIQPGGNYGWDEVEGDAYSTGFVEPAYSYGHVPVDSAVSAIAAYSGSSFGPAYAHTVFFGDYNRQDIEAVTFDPSYSTATSDTVFDQAAGTIADLIEGPDGNLYFASIFEGTVNEISTTGSTPSASPNPYQPPQPVSGAPVASVSGPSSYNAGDTVAFSGSATSPTDGSLPASDFTWQADYYRNGVVKPFYSREVPGPVSGPSSGSTSFSFTVPADTSQVPDSFYRVTLTVTDSTGSRTVVTKDITPDTATLTTSSSTPGAGYFVDGTWHTGTYSTTGVVGVRHVLSGLGLAQSVGGNGYRFHGWSDGAALWDQIALASQGTTVTAGFDQVGSALPAGWSATDVGSPLMAGTTRYDPASGSFYLDGAGADVYGTNEQHQYAYQTLNGDGSITARVRYQSVSSPWAKAGVMIRQNTTAGSPFVDVLATPDISSATPTINGVNCTSNGCDSQLPPDLYITGHGQRMQYSGSHSVTPPSGTAPLTAPDKWIRLVRKADTFTSYQSGDGLHWTQIGIATVPMTGPVTIGLFDTSHNIGQYSTAAFDQVSVTAGSGTPLGPLPAPWQQTDVGSPALAGSAGFDSATGAFTVIGGGADIWNTSDQFHYVYQPTSGDGTFVARLTSESNTSSSAKAGIIWKQSTTAGSNYLLIAQAPGGGVKVQYNFSGSAGGGTYAFPNVWMKLTRTGDTFVAYLSSDGTTWTQVLSKSTLSITAAATVGLFECSHNTSALGTATFDHVSWTTA